MIFFLCRFLSFCGYYDFKKIKKKVLRLLVIDLKFYSIVLFQLIFQFFVSKWNEIKDDIFELVKCFNIYVDQLDKVNEE